CLDVLDRTGPVGIEHGDDIPDLGKEIVGHHEFSATGAQDRGDPDSAVPGELGDRRQGGKTDAATQHHDVLPGWINRKADAERPDHVELIARFEGRQSVGAAADAFVEKLDPAVLPTAPVDTLWAAQPELAGIRRRTEQIEELAGLDRERL